MIPNNFGREGERSLGVEEELFVVAAETLEPVPFPEAEFDGKRLKRELFRSVVELNTSICRSVDEVAAELEDRRTAARAAAGRAGAAVAGSGTWPTAVPEEQEISDKDPYTSFVEYAGSSARRQYCSGLHVHVGMRDWHACMDAMEAILPWLPVILAASANSPYLAGRETDLASNRAEILALLPRSGAPPPFGYYTAWEQFAEQLIEFGLADDYTRIWWDVRPHPHLGTLEIRMPDQPTKLEVTVAFVALIEALVKAVDGPGPQADRAVYAENRWAAFRFGRRAELIHPDGSRLVSAPELLNELLERVQPTARKLGSADYLTPLNGLTQAEEQLEIGRSAGLRELCERLVALT